MKKLYRALKYFIFWVFTRNESYKWESWHYWYMEKFAPLAILNWATHHNRFKYFWRFGKAVNYVEGRKERIEQADAIHFPAQGGRWVRVAFTFYFQTNKKGYRV